MIYGLWMRISLVYVSNQKKSTLLVAEWEIDAITDELEFLQRETWNSDSRSIHVSIDWKSEWMETSRVLFGIWGCTGFKFSYMVVMTIHGSSIDLSGFNFLRHRIESLLAVNYTEAADIWSNLTLVILRWWRFKHCKNWKIEKKGFGKSPPWTRKIDKCKSHPNA